MIYRFQKKQLGQQYDPSKKLQVTYDSIDTNRMLIKQFREEAKMSKTDIQDA